MHPCDRRTDILLYGRAMVYIRLCNIWCRALKSLYSIGIWLIYVKDNIYSLAARDGKSAWLLCGIGVWKCRRRWISSNLQVTSRYVTYETFIVDQWCVDCLLLYPSVFLSHLYPPWRSFTHWKIGYDGYRHSEWRLLHDFANHRQMAWPTIMHSARQTVMLLFGMLCRRPARFFLPPKHFRILVASFRSYKLVCGPSQPI